MNYHMHDHAGKAYLRERSWLTRQSLSLMLRCITNLQIGVDMAALFAGAKLQVFRRWLIVRLM